MDNNFTAISQLKFWCQKVLPLVYDDSLSYYEVLCKIQSKINDLIENNSKLPQFIIDLIISYLEGEEFQRIMAELLSDLFINVKYPPTGIPPAKGDGTSDDTATFQGCIDYCESKGGLSTYVPSGNYIVQSLTLKNGTSLEGSDRYSCKIVLKGGATQALLKGTVNKVSLKGLYLSANSGSQTNNVNTISLNADSSIISDCVITGGYDTIDLTVNNDAQLSDLIIDQSSRKALKLSGLGMLTAINIIANNLSTVSGVSFVDFGLSKSLMQISLKSPAPVGVSITGNNNVIKFFDGGSVKPYEDSGNNNNVEVFTVSKSEKFSGEVKTTANSSTENVVNNKTINSKSISLQAETETETITNSKTLTSPSLTENVGVKNENITTSTETITGKKSVSALDGDFSINNVLTVKAPTGNINIDNITATATSIIENAEDISINGTNTSITAQQITLDSVNPAKYGALKVLDNADFKYVDAKDMAGVPYKVLADNGKKFLEKNTGNPSSVTYNSTPNQGVITQMCDGDNATPSTKKNVASVYTQRVDNSYANENDKNTPNILICNNYNLFTRQVNSRGYGYTTLNYLQDDIVTPTGNAVAQSVSCAGMAYATGNSAVWGLYGDAYSYNPKSIITGAEFNAQNYSGEDYAYKANPVDYPFSCGVWVASFGTKPNSFAIGVGSGNYASRWHCGMFFNKNSIDTVAIDIKATPPVLIRLSGSTVDGAGTTPGGIGIDAGVGAKYGQGVNQGVLHIRDQDICFGDTGLGKIRWNGTRGSLDFIYNGVTVGHLNLAGADHEM